MNDDAGRQCSRCWHGRGAGLEWSVPVDPGIGFLLNGRSACSGDCTRHPSTMQEVLVGRIDDGIDILSGEVSLQHTDSRVGIGHTVRLRD